MCFIYVYFWNRKMDNPVCSSFCYDCTHARLVLKRFLQFGFCREMWLVQTLIAIRNFKGVRSLWAPGHSIIRLPSSAGTVARRRWLTNTAQFRNSTLEFRVPADQIAFMINGRMKRALSDGPR